MVIVTYGMGKNFLFIRQAFCTSTKKDLMNVGEAELNFSFCVWNEKAITTYSLWSTKAMIQVQLTLLNTKGWMGKQTIMSSATIIGLQSFHELQIPGISIFYK